MRHMRNLQPIWQSYHACERWLSLAMTVDPKQLHFFEFPVTFIILNCLSFSCTIFVSHINMYILVTGRLTQTALKILTRTTWS